MGVVCLILESVALIEASLEELPMSAILGQRCLATMIRAPGPSYFGWFRHTNWPQTPLDPQGEGMKSDCSEEQFDQYLFEVSPIADKIVDGLGNA